MSYIKLFRPDGDPVEIEGRSVLEIAGPDLYFWCFLALLCHGSARAPKDQLKTKVATIRSRLEPMLQQAQTDADNLLAALIHQLAKG